MPRQTFQRQTGRDRVSRIRPWQTPCWPAGPVARRGMGQPWPTEVAEGWLPGPALIFGRRFRRSQPGAAQEFGLVGADMIAYMFRHGVMQTPRQTADRPSSAPLAPRGAHSWT